MIVMGTVFARLTVRELAMVLPILVVQMALLVIMTQVPRVMMEVVIGGVQMTALEIITMVVTHAGM
jgi:tetrahydromethanopterin S-methyltransferase subunit C